MKNEDFIKKELIFFNTYICNFFKNIPYKNHHLDHLKRVGKTCLEIGKKLNADLLVLEVAALFHDICRIDEDHGKCHAELSADFLDKFLTERSWDKDLRNKICYAIRLHRYSTGIIPETIEAKILQDSDRLDALGAIGIIRVASHDPETALYNLIEPFPDNRPISKEYVIDHFYDKILKLKDIFHTEEAKRIAKHRHEYLLLFLNELRNEIC